MVGAAYETALFGGDVKTPDVDFIEVDDAVDVSVVNEDNGAVPYYSLRVVKGWRLDQRRYGCRSV